MSSLRNILTYLRRLAPFLIPYKNQCLFILGLLSANVIASSLPPLIFGRIIDSLTFRQLNVVVILVSFQFVIGTVVAYIAYRQSVSTASFAQSLGRDLRVHLSERIRAANLSTFIFRPIGEITNRLDGDIEALVGSILAIVPSVISVGTLALVIVILPFVNWRLAILGYLFIPLWFFGVLPFGSALSSVRKSTSEAKDKIDTIIAEDLSIGGVIRAKAHSGYLRDSSRLRSALDNYRAWQIALTSQSAIAGMRQSLIGGLAPSIILLAGAWLIVRGECTLGGLVAFMGLLTRAYSPVSSLAGLQIQLTALCGVFERIMEVFDLAPEVTGRDRPEGCHIVVENLSFSYGGRPLFNGLSLEVAFGERVAIVGPSGCGKTTLVQLLLRFYEPHQGKITIGNTDAGTLRLEELRELIGYVPQEPAMFSGTIRDNLCYARPDANEWDCRRILAICQLDEFVETLPLGLDTPIGGNGAALSGGQRQRLAIAQTLLREPQILVLDESTSGIDVDTEARLLNALADVENMTLIVVSHRPLETLKGLRIIHLQSSAERSHVRGIYEVAS